MNMTVSTEEIKKYLSGVFELEINKYIQERTIANIEQKYYSLGRRRNISKPAFEKAKFTESFGTGFYIGAPICAVLAAIVAFILEFEGTFWTFIGSAIMAVIYAALGAVIGGLPLGLIISFFIHKAAKRKIKSQNEAGLKSYSNSINKENSRINRETGQKEVLKRELDVLRECYSRTKSNLQKAYSYNILEPDYRNIYAVSSIYGYIKKGRTQTLTFNSNTGDQGAYNIYEQERRLDIIITNTDEILRRLDDVINNQYELANGLRQANTKINSLCNNVNNHMERIRGSVERIETSQSVIAYNSERAANELAFLNWMNCIR